MPFDNLAEAIDNCIDQNQPRRIVKIKKTGLYAVQRPDTPFLPEWYTLVCESFAYPMTTTDWNQEITCPSTK